MEKLAISDYALHLPIAERWSPRAFASTPVEKDKLCSLFEAARWAASCFNEQPWNFIVATQDDTSNFQKLLGCLRPGNLAWAQAAPVLILAIAKTTQNRDNSPNPWAEYDTGQAVATLAVQATSMGLFMHQMGGFVPEKAVAAFNLPEYAKPMAAIALGYPGEASHLSPELQQREVAPRVRHSLQDFVFTGEWQKSASFL